MLNEEVAKYRELSGDTNPDTPISRIGGYLDGYDKALEQEPILDKIRAEIMKLQTYKMFKGEDAVYVECEDVLQIIDKYREEQEDNGFFNEIMDDESDGEVYEKIKEIIDKVKEQEK